MLVTMLTAMYMMVKVVESISLQFERKPEPLPYMVSQPLPWQVHSVSHSRKNSRTDEFDGYRRNSIGVYRKNSNVGNGTCVGQTAPPLSPVEVEKAAATIQTHFRKFQQKKVNNGK
ncbi:unnamed protein product [Knipowitschia caucasica]|uniref:Uncharacterized protein n=1 Tax=Knipowitschia caucasica TaxID=637954 RepID=A0AAV2J1A9_KNICA